MMTQEEINAMLGGLDDDEEEKKDESSTEVTPEPEPEIESKDDISSSEQNLPESSNSDDSNDEEKQEPVSSENSIEENITETPPIDCTTCSKAQEIASDDLSNGSLINAIPSNDKADDDHRVVDQLTEVTEEGERKASEMFDLIAKVSDDTMEVQGLISTSISELHEYIELMDTLNKKFPNVTVFDEKMRAMEGTVSNLKEADSKLGNINNDIFSAMELMQYQDITRQKIERVISIIRELSSYINRIFSDTHKKEIKVAQHISGDDGTDLVGLEELDDLISEFKKK